MAMFFFIFGIFIIAFAIFCFIYMTYCDYVYEDLWFGLGLASIVIGLSITVFSAFSVFGENTPTSPKLEETLRIETTDSLGMIIEKDTVYSIKFIIYSNEGNRINVGNGIVLEGYTNKSIGDTITVNLK